MNLALIGNTTLRAAIQANLVSFPSQIPVFTKGGQEQKRIVHLYFVSRWEISEISRRYRVGKWAIRTILSDWRTRAIGAGYIQEIHPEILETMAVEENIEPTERFESPAPPLDFAASETSWVVDLSRQLEEPQPGSSL
jgi:hypothetical protein